jgi:hypothetical protein
MKDASNKRGTERRGARSAGSFNSGILGALLVIGQLIVSRFPSIPCKQ